MHMVARGSGIHMGALDPKEAPLTLSFSSVWMRENKFLSPMFMAQDNGVVDGLKSGNLEDFQINKCLLSHYRLMRQHNGESAYGPLMKALAFAELWM